MFISVVLSIIGIFKTYPEKEAITVDWPFRLHYMFTCAMVFFFTSIMGLQDAFGKNIICRNAKDQPWIEQYCWVTGTRAPFKNCEDLDAATSEFFIKQGCTCGTDTKWKLESGGECPHANDLEGYYQWVPYFLLILGCLFYMPKIFWEYIEDGKMKEITKGILVGTVQNKDYEKKVKEVGQSVKKYVNMKNAGHASYGWGFLGAQVMNLCVVLISFYLCNDFLGGNFSMLGYHFYKEIIDSKPDVLLSIVFPRTTTCDYKYFGSAGGPSNKAPRCVMALNAVSEKVFVILWFWFLLLIVINIANLIILVLMAVKSQGIRKLFIRKSAGSKTTGRDLRETKLDKELKKLDFGQFLFLYFLGRNIDYTTFRAILKAIAPEPNEVETEGIAMQALGEPSAPERRGSDLPGYTDLAPQAATKDPYPYPSIEPCEKDTGDEEINAPKKEL